MLSGLALRRCNDAPALPAHGIAVLNAGRSMVILVDDDSDVLNSLRFAFEIEGFEVDAHASAESLLARGVLPRDGCLVVDQRLPGMDGLELVSRLRERGSRLPSILITTPTADVIRRASAAGVTIVEKPLLCDTLVGRVKSLISGEQTPGLPH